MKTLRSYVSGAWHQATSGFTELYDPSTEQPIARASSSGIDFAAAIGHARERGGAALRELTFAERGALLAAMSAAIHAIREELIELSLRATGSTRKDAKFDIDGATATLSFYAGLGTELGARRMLLDGDGVQLGRTAKFWGQHVRVARAGVAVHINAFNFPAWGFAEKAAAAILAGMPIITKPATSTAPVAERAIEAIIAAAVLPQGVLSLVCGALGDLLDRLGPQDVVAFTGSAATAAQLRRRENLLAASVRVNVEAVSLNAAVLGPDCEPGSETWNLFLRDVEREITQKSGQKCTAVRRILVPSARLAEVEAELGSRLEAVVPGNPADAKVTMGPLATAQQLADAVRGVRLLAGGARLLLGRGERIDGMGAPRGKGYFFPVCLLRADDARAAAIVHRHEVFGPVSTLLPYDGNARDAAAIIALGEGSLVSSAYSDDLDFVGELVSECAPWSGRLYLGSEKMAEQAPGSGLALPMSLHGGPGRAGGGEELGGLRALDLYTQRTALQGSRPMLERLTGAREER